MKMTTQTLPTINRTLCTRCGKCVSECLTQAVDLIDSFPVITRPEDCSYCGLCEEICPQNAISLSYSISLKKKL
jgi:NAD-dependent dihydropyrimidine dehydrogenase PreA subunit